MYHTFSGIYHTFTISPIYHTFTQHFPLYPPPPQASSIFVPPPPQATKVVMRLYKPHGKYLICSENAMGQRTETNWPEIRTKISFFYMFQKFPTFLALFTFFLSPFRCRGRVQNLGMVPPSSTARRGLGIYTPNLPSPVAGMICMARHRERPTLDMLFSFL
jgi:hypothetical protein